MTEDILFDITDVDAQYIARKEFGEALTKDQLKKLSSYLFINRTIRKVLKNGITKVMENDK